jgi:putative holliday junction resolvase
MGRVMGIDVGKKRIGLAVTDPLRIFATGLATVPANEVFKYLSGYAENEKIDAFVVGMPVQMNNKPSESVSFVMPFIKRLEKLFPGIPVITMDERFTSKMAKQAMIEGGMHKNARRDKATADRISAVIILQSYLDQVKIK